MKNKIYILTIFITLLYTAGIDTTHACSVGLHVGSRGTAVSCLQQMLTITGDYTYGEITGYYGPVTGSALNQFNHRLGNAAVTSTDYPTIISLLTSVVKRLTTLLASTSGAVVERHESSGSGSTSQTTSDTTQDEDGADIPVAILDAGINTAFEPWSMWIKGSGLGSDMTVTIYDTDDSVWLEKQPLTVTGDTTATLALAPGNIPPSMCNVRASCRLEFQLADSSGTFLSGTHSVTLPGTYIRGITLAKPLDLAWPLADWKNDKAEFMIYLDRLKEMGIHSIRILIPLKIFNSGDAGLASQQIALKQMTDELQKRNMTLYPYIVLKTPSNVGLEKVNDDPNQYAELLSVAKQRINATVAYLANATPKTAVIVGYSIGNGENNWNLANVQFAKDMMAYTKALDPYHAVTSEGQAGFYRNDQMVSLPNTGTPDPLVAERSTYDRMDLVSFANYRGAKSPTYSSSHPDMDTLLMSIKSQNTNKLPVIVEEYGSTLGGAAAVDYLKDLQEIFQSHKEVTHVYYWAGHVDWNKAAVPSMSDADINFSPFKYDTSAAYNLGGLKDWAQKTWGSTGSSN